MLGGCLSGVQDEGQSCQPGNSVIDSQIDYIANLVWYSLHEQELIRRRNASNSVSPSLEERIVKFNVPVKLRQSRINSKSRFKRIKFVTLRPVIESWMK